MSAAILGAILNVDNVANDRSDHNYYLKEQQTTETTETKTQQYNLSMSKSASGAVADPLGFNGGSLEPPSSP